MKRALTQTNDSPTGRLAGKAKTSMPALVDQSAHTVVQYARASSAEASTPITRKCMFGAYAHPGYLKGDRRVAI